MPRLACAARDMQTTMMSLLSDPAMGEAWRRREWRGPGCLFACWNAGREFLPGDFPDSLMGSQREMQTSGGRFRFGSRTALFDLAMGDGVHVLSGCGLGGTSLINANVCLTPHQAILEDPAWPERLRYDPWLNLGYYPRAQNAAADRAARPTLNATQTGRA